MGLAELKKDFVNLSNESTNTITACNNVVNILGGLNESNLSSALTPLDKLSIQLQNEIHSLQATMNDSFELEIILKTYNRNLSNCIDKCNDCIGVISKIKELIQTLQELIQLDNEIEGFLEYTLRITDITIYKHNFTLLSRELTKVKNETINYNKILVKGNRK